MNRRSFLRALPRSGPDLLVVYRRRAGATCTATISVTARWLFKVAPTLQNI